MVIECFIGGQMEFSPYRNRPSKVSVSSISSCPTSWRMARQTWGPERSSDLPEVTQPDYIAGTQIWYPSMGVFSLASGRYLGMRAESLYGFQPRQWKLDTWLVCLLTDHMTCELVPDRLLEQEVFHSTCVFSAASTGVWCVQGSPISSLTFVQTKLRIDWIDGVCFNS